MKPLALLLALALAGFFGWKHFFEKTPEIDPREKVEAVLNQSVIPSTELAEICSAYPELCRAALHNRKIRVSGVAQKILVTGVGSHDLSIQLQGTSTRRVTLASDVNRVARMNRAAPSGQFKFEKHGREIIVYQAGTQSSSRSPRETESLEPKPPQSVRVFLRELDTVTLEAVFKHINQNAVILEWRQPNHL